MTTQQMDAASKSNDICVFADGDMKQELRGTTQPVKKSSEAKAPRKINIILNSSEELKERAPLK